LHQIIVVSLLTAIYSSALFGWGYLLVHLFRIAWPFPFTICLGMAVWIFLGGILNMLEIAYPLALDSITLLGLGFSVLIFLRYFNFKTLINAKQFSVSKDFLIRILPSAILIVIIFIFIAYTQSSPKAFNFHDDMEKYLSHPVRMLATGSLNGSLFNSLPSETFGGQAFLHAFVAAHWPIGYVNAVDSVFAFILCLISILSSALRMRLPFWIIPLILIIFILINPQYVNISAIYTAVALILFLSLGIWISLDEEKFTLSRWSVVLCLGLIYSALIVLKTIYLLFVIVHFSLLWVGFIYISRSWKNAICWGAKVVAFVIFFTSPWIITYSANWFALISNFFGPSSFLLDAGYYRYPAKTIDLFSTNPLFYGFGSTMAHYTFTMILVGSCCIFLFIFKYSLKLAFREKVVMVLAACGTPPILYVVNFFLIAPLLTGPDHTLRYLTPIIIAAVPSALMMTTTSVSESIKKINFKKQASIYLIILAIFSAGLIYSFYESFSERTLQAFRYGSTLSFQKLARNTKYLKYNQFALSSDAKKEVRKAQNIVPEGKVLLSWTPLAFHLDYQRNSIVDIDPAGLANPWIEFPFGKGSKDGIKYFDHLGAHYLLWQYRGFAVRSGKNLLKWAASPYARSHAIGVRTHQFVRMLSEMAKETSVLYDNGAILIMKLSD
jgi:hypothetical protein